jgi:hypothetical protein
MLMRRLILINLLAVSLSACASPQPISLATAQATLMEAWSADQHTIWEINWPAAPLGGSLAVETWRAGPRYRYEILEAPAPALIGETLVFDGQTAWRYNRFDDPPLSSHLQREEIAEPALSPVSDAFALVNRLMTTPPEAATQEAVQLNHRPAQKITMTFANGDQLALWREEQTGLPIQIIFKVGTQHATLQARSFERLVNPPEGLFKP